MDNQQLGSTIYALSSGGLPSGVAVVRVSGPMCRDIWGAMVGREIVPRLAMFTAVKDPRDGQVLDHGVALFFAKPASFTGEDVIELQIHGGRAGVAAVLEALGSVANVQQAEAGAFTRQAFANGKMDLTAVEGLSDLLAAETRAQHRQSLRLASGHLRQAADGWRDRLIQAMGLVEAAIDFSDEGDVGGPLVRSALALVGEVRQEIIAALSGQRAAERVRDGFRVVLMGPPNAGKSSLLNALAGRDVAIVSAMPGTTRDVLTVHLDLSGYAVVVSDTAGLRESADEIEAEGIRRAHREGIQADLILWLSEGGVEPVPEDVQRLGVDVWAVATKADDDASGLAISVKRGDGLDGLLDQLRGVVGSFAGEGALVSHQRQADCLRGTLAGLERAMGHPDGLEEMIAEDLRGAASALGRLTGRVDVEDILGSIFSTFCVGK